MEIKFTYLQFTLYLCVVRSLSAIRGVFEGENRGGKFRRNFGLPVDGGCCLTRPRFSEMNSVNKLHILKTQNFPYICACKQVFSNIFLPTVRKKF